MIVFLLAIACTGETVGAGSDDSDDGGGGGVSPDAPTILGLDVYCCNPASGQPAWYWVLESQVSDPQGADTIAQAGADSGNEVNVFGAGGGGQPLAEYGAGFACNDKGECQASWQQQTDNILCDGSAENYEIELIVADEDGHQSEPKTVPGKQTSC